MDVATHEALTLDLSRFFFFFLLFRFCVSLLGVLLRRIQMLMEVFLPTT